MIRYIGLFMWAFLTLLFFCYLQYIYYNRSGWCIITHFSIQQFIFFTTKILSYSAFFCLNEQNVKNFKNDCYYKKYFFKKFPILKVKMKFNSFVLRFLMKDLYISITVRKTRTIFTNILKCSIIFQKSYSLNLFYWFFRERVRWFFNVLPF